MRALPFRLALADLLGEARMSLCTVLAVAAVVAPLLVLAGLRAGAVEGLRQAVLLDPAAREIEPLSNALFPHAFLDALRARPEVAHVSPRTRVLSARLLLETPDAARQGWAQVVPSSPGDPLLPQGAPAEANLVTLSASMAARLGLGPGSPLVGRLGRVTPRGEERLRIELMVDRVAPPTSFDRDAVFVMPVLADGLEDWAEGRSGVSSSQAGLPVALPRDGYASFRLYARQLEDVAPLVEMLAARGVETRSRLRDIAPIMTVDRALSRLLLAIAGISGLGLVLSLGAGLWANVERKRLLLAGLRLMGFSRGAVLCLPMTQAALLALAGMALGGAVALLTQIGINAGLGGVVQDRPLSLIGPAMLAIGTGIVLVAALLASALAAWRAARIEPYEAVKGS